MLKRLIARVGVLSAVSTALVLGAAAPALADYVYCPPVGDCYVVVEKPGGGGGTGGGGGGGTDDQSLCIWKLLEPQPPAGDPLWEGHQPGDGAVYFRLCKAGRPGGVAIEPEYMWSATPLPTISPAELAARAINNLPIRGPDIGTAPNPGGAGLVGLPVWLWTAVGPTTWGPATATATVPGLSVTATARATQIVWSMGNGDSVTCTNPGTPHNGQSGPSPTCGYNGYSQPSSTVSGGRYRITGVTTWQVTWAGGGQTGELTVTRQSTTTIDIDEMQVVTR